MIGALLVALFAASDVGAQTLAKQLFGAQSQASAQRPTPYGIYQKGCLAGGVELPETGPTWQAMRLSRNRNWGHPDAIDYIKDLSAFAATQPGWQGLYIGDISQPRGGPMLTGHRSHQTGLDIDIWMLPASRINLTREFRENVSSISMQRAKGAYVNDNWSRAHHRILKEAAKDPRVARIFVFAGAKVQMCKDAKGNRNWLRKIRPWYGHHYHFHVRLKCPRRARNCENQDPPPRGDGCDEAQAWVNERILKTVRPKPPDPNAPKVTPKPRREIVLADLPQQCTAVLQSR